MDAQQAIRFYVDKVVSDPQLGGMKALLLDDVTMQTMSMVYSQTQVLEKEVYLIERLTANHERMTHLKAAVFIRPTPDNIRLLKQEFSDPKFGEYHIFFSYICPRALLEQLGAADEHGAIKQVQEYYGDYLAVNSDLFSLNMNKSTALSVDCRGATMPLAMKGMFQRSVEGVCSVLLSLKKRPSAIRYSGGSDITRQLAEGLDKTLKQDGIFDFPGQSSAPLLLIMDRRDDPVTPLLTQWTYQAMVHELLGLNNNRCVLRGAPGITKDLEEVVLSSTQDAFFQRHMHSNFGDLGAAVKGLLEEYQKKMDNNQKLSSIEDMQRFLDSYPAFRSQSLNVSKHVAVMGELARLVEKHQLMEVSALEQELACNDEHSAQYRQLQQLLRQPGLGATDKLRLGCLYALHYDSHSSFQLPLLQQQLRDGGVPAARVQLLDAVLAYAGRTRRTGAGAGGGSCGLFGHSGGNLMDKLKSMATGLQGVDNVYCQHQPLLMQLLDQLGKGKLKDSGAGSYPFAGTGGNSRERATDIIVFVAGGVTFEESTKVAEFNAVPGNPRVLVGGSCVHNSSSFLSEISEFFGAE